MALQPFYIVTAEKNKIFRELLLSIFEESFEFEEVNGETKVTCTMSYELPYSLLGKLLDILTVENSIRVDLQKMLERLKTNVESL